MFTLRDYQFDAVSAIYKRLETDQTTLCVCATGLGKMVIAAFLIAEYVKRGRVLFLAHRHELLEQAWEKINRVSGLHPELEKAGNYARLGSHLSGRFGDVVISSIQTQISPRGPGRRHDRFDPFEFALLVIDEVHRARSASYEMVIRHYLQNPAIKVVGTTATPNRTDKRAMGEIFQSVAYEMGTAEGVAKGWLVRPRVAYTTIHSLDLSSVKVSGGDFAQADLARVMQAYEPLNQVAKATLDDCGDRKTIVFTVSVEQAKMLSEIINAHKPGSAQYVTGKTEDQRRHEMIRDFRVGKFQYLVNVAVLTEGLDIPDCSAIVMARPTKSQLVFQQQLGRALRPLSGIVDPHPTPEARIAAIAASSKPDALIVDLVGNSGKHKLSRATDILGGDKDAKVRELAERKMQASDRPLDVVTALEDAEKEISEEAREVAAKLGTVRARARKTMRWVDVLDEYDIHPTQHFGWRTHRPATDKQKNALQRYKIDPTGINIAQASAIIGRKKEEWVKARQGPCTPKQAAFLRWKGFDPSQYNKAQASAIIGKIVSGK